MEAILQHIGMVPGVIGSCMCAQDGQLLARSFPAQYDSSFLQKAAAVLKEIAAGLPGQDLGTRLIEHHSDVGRIIVRQIPEGFIAIFCTDAINVQLLTMSLNVAQSSITKLVQKRQSQPAALNPEPRTAPTTQAASTQPANHILRRDGKGVVLTVDTMKISASLKWNQMEESIAISDALMQEIRKVLKIDAFKKIKLSNKSAGCSKSFNVTTFKRENSQNDDKIVLTLAAAEALKSKPGDEITAEPSTGGLFGWG